MANKWIEFRERQLSTHSPNWRIELSCVALFFLSTGTVLSWWYAYITLPEAVCHKGIFYLSALWLAVQWTVIGYLYWYRNIPVFARAAVAMLMVMANVWFGLFLFTLQPCVS